MRRARNNRALPFLLLGKLYAAAWSEVWLFPMSLPLFSRLTSCAMHQAYASAALCQLQFCSILQLW